MKTTDPIQLPCLSCSETFETTYAEWKDKRGSLRCPHCGKTNKYGQSDVIAASGHSKNAN